MWLINVLLHVSILYEINEFYTYLSGPQLILQCHNPSFERFLVGREGHGLGHDDVVVQHLNSLLSTLHYISPCLLIGRYIQHHWLPLRLHLIKSLQEGHSGIN